MIALDWIVRAVLAGGLMRQAGRAREMVAFGGAAVLETATACELAALEIVS